nr:LacI family DNA-binding transcriptional regulator [uncultured Mediterraneibacter sp.]
MAATIRDIRDRTGLSLATISKYLNGGNVLPRNRQLIEEAIEELHYEVNEIARGLVTNRTKTIGVLVYDVQCIFVGRMLHHLGQALHEKGYGMLICDSCNDLCIEEKNLQFLLSRKVDGILVFAVSLDGKFLEAANRAEVPVVLLDRAFRDKEYDCIEIDNRTAMLRATNKLISRNHRRIALIASDIEYTGMERMKGFDDALGDAGITVPDEYRVRGRHSFELGYRGMRTLLCLPDPPTAVILGNYDTTLGGIMAVNESGCNCPNDISIIGFDDLLMSKVIRPKLWIVSQPMEEMSNRAVEMLLNRISGQAEGGPLRISFSAQIREGESIRKL